MLLCWALVEEIVGADSQRLRFFSSCMDYNVNSRCGSRSEN